MVYTRKFEQDLIEYLSNEDENQEISPEQQLIVNYLKKSAKDSLKRKLIIATLIKLRIAISGETSDAIRKLYCQTGLVNYALAKLKDKKWDVVATGIRELTQFEIKDAHDEILLHVNHRKRVVRLEIQRYLVKLFHFKGLEFLNILETNLTEWDQIRLIEILKKFEGEQTPDFSQWLASSNKAVVSFAIKLTRTFYQYDAINSLINLLDHSDETIRIDAIELLAYFGNMESLSILKNDFNQRNLEEQITIFKIMESQYDISDVPFIANHSTSEIFEIRTSALKILKAIDDDKVNNIINSANMMSNYNEVVSNNQILMETESSDNIKYNQINSANMMSNYNEVVSNNQNFIETESSDNIKYHQINSANMMSNYNQVVSNNQNHIADEHSNNIENHQINSTNMMSNYNDVVSNNQNHIENEPSNNIENHQIYSTNMMSNYNDVVSNDQNPIENEPSQSLNDLESNLTEWELNRLIESLTKFEDENTPDFSPWLASSNSAIVSFAIKLTRTFNQTNSINSLIKLLDHTDNTIRIDAIELLAYFGDTESLSILKNNFNQRNIEEQIIIFKIMETRYEISDVPFIEYHSNNENFEIRTSALNILKAIDDNKEKDRKKSTTILSKNIVVALNNQIRIEAESSQTYLSMASWAEINAFEGISQFMYAESDKKRIHMLKLIKYVNKRGASAEISELNGPRNNYKSFKDMFEELYKHEVFVSESINELVHIAVSEKDYLTNNFLQCQVAEQIEEESIAKTILDKINLIRDDEGGLYLFDREILEMNTVAPKIIS